MKIPIIFFLGIVFFSGNVFAGSTTFILFRHAEKDVSSPSDKNPGLSEAGKKRAEKLVMTIKKYRPQEIFSTVYLRTRATVTPLAFDLIQPYRLQIGFYDSGEQEVFAEKLLKSKSKCIAVVGHSNTIPALANLLLKEDRFKDLADSEYNKIFIIKVRKKKATVEVIEY